MAAQQRKLKIAQVIDDTLDLTDGVQQIVLAVGQWLESQGHEVHYITSTAERFVGEGIHPIAGNVRFRFNGNRVGTPLPASRKKIRQLLKRERFDVVHIQIPYSPFLAGRIISALPERTALLGTFMILPLSRLAAWGGKALGLTQRKQIARFDELLALSAPASDFSEYMYGRPALPVGSPVDVEYYGKARDEALAAKEEDKPVKILFLGRLVERKGAGALLEAVAQVRALTNTPFTVEIAGRGPLLAQYEAFVTDHHLGDRVTFSGFVEEEDKAGLLASADIIALPAFGGESFGVSVVEALAAGAGSVLAGNNPGYSSVIGPLTECLIDPTDTAAMARTLATHIDDAALRAEMSARQVERAREFAPDVVGAKIMAAYRRAIAGRKNQP